MGNTAKHAAAACGVFFLRKKAFRVRVFSPAAIRQK
jgi:hypothetical protein